MHDLGDNRLGSVFILDGWDEKTHRFTRVCHYLDHLRNPNNLAFWTDPATGQSWLYLPLTDKLLRYRYNAGDSAPASAPETLIRFPDYGLHYKYGGWHLTRTVSVANVAGATRIVVAVGSSCNYCQEDEALRAAVVSMDPDGKHERMEAQGLRNAVDLHQVPGLDGGAIFATNMGDDHLGDKLPEDTFFEVAVNANPVPNYGWPTCYFAGGKPALDTTLLPSLNDARKSGKTAGGSAEDSVYGKQTGVAAAGTNLGAGGGRRHEPDPNSDLGKAPEALKSCDKVPLRTLHSPRTVHRWGLHILVSRIRTLEGVSLSRCTAPAIPGIGTGYKVVRFTASDRVPLDFITGFLTIQNGKPKVHGRPCGILRLDRDRFLLSDDYLGLIYYVHSAKLMADA